jgi:hypothetical protein
MRMPAFVSGLLSLLLVLFASAFGAHAETYKTPQALIKALYAFNPDDGAVDAPSPYSAFYSKGLNRLFEKDRDTTAEGEVGSVDFDPVISGQDGEAKNVRLSPPILTDNRAELEVSFTNGGKVTLYYTLVREQGGWKVDDIANQEGEFPWSLRALLGE